MVRVMPESDKLGCYIAVVISGFFFNDSSWKGCGLLLSKC